MFNQNLSTPFLYIYCISLTNSTERRSHIRKELARYNFTNYKFLDAISHDSKAVEQAYSSGSIKKFPPCFRCGLNICDCENNFLLPTQVAAFMSHKKTWEMIANKENGLYLIIEDDIKFNWYFKFLRQKIYQKIKKYYANKKNEPILFRLAWAKDKNHRVQKVKLECNMVLMSNPMYAINPSMAQMLLNSFQKITTTVDIYTHRNIASKLNHYTLLPPMAHELSFSTAKLPSLIRPRKPRIDKLKKRQDDKSKNELMMYQEHVDCAINRKLLVIGHPRTGSGYINALLKSYGINTEHEKMGKDGIVSWMFSVYDFDNPFWLNKYARSKYYTNFEHTIMFARDPYTAIPSIMREDIGSPISYEFRRRHLLKYNDLNNITSDFEKSIESYSLWTKLNFDENNPEIVIKIESDAKVLLKYLQENNFETSSIESRQKLGMVNKDKRYNGKQISKPLVFTQDWLDLNDKWKFKLNDLCYSLGYEPIFNEKLTKILR